MSEWKEYKLGEICEVTSSKRIFYSEYISSGVPFYRSKEIIDLYNKRDISTELFISDEKYYNIKNKFGVPKPDDILLTSVGSLGIPYKVKLNDKFYFKDGNITWFRNFDKKLVNPDYLIYWLCSRIGIQKLDEITIGSTQAALTISGLKTISITLPSLEEQRTIAGVLGTLDDKIDLLYRQNQTLESMAETLFRNYFIDNAQPDWEEKSLVELVEINGGFSYKGEYIGDGASLLLGMGCVSFDKRFLSSGARPYSRACPEKYLVSPGDLVIATRQQSDNMPILGFPAIIPDEFKGKKVIVGANLYKVKNNSKLSNYFLYLLLRTPDYRNHIIACSKGTTVKMITKDAIESYQISLPPKDLIIKYQDVLNSFNQKVNTISNQICTLTKLRETLLPKLMNSEIKID